MDTKKKKKVVDLSRIENYDTQAKQNRKQKQREKRNGTDRCTSTSWCA